MSHDKLAISEKTGVVNPVECKFCNGSGRVFNQCSDILCGVCFGAGEVTQSTNDKHELTATQLLNAREYQAAYYRCRRAYVDSLSMLSVPDMGLTDKTIRRARHYQSAYDWRLEARAGRRASDRVPT